MYILSVIFPCYNESSNIVGIISSIKSALQGRNDVEIILVDNGSTDSTPQVLEQALQGEHNKQLYGKGNEIHFQHGLHRRSIFGMKHIYIRLPQEIVDCVCVSSFQRELTLIARKKCEDGRPDWSVVFSGRSRKFGQ